MLGSSSEKCQARPKARDRMSAAASAGDTADSPVAASAAVDRLDNMAVATAVVGCRAVDREDRMFVVADREPVVSRQEPEPPRDYRYESSIR